MNLFLSKKKGILYTVIMSILLTGTIIGIMVYMYAHTENEAFERLSLETTKQKNSINLQLTSDRETLTSMANLIGINYNSNAGYIEVCKSFESFGLCREIGILVPGDILITKHGLTNVKGYLSFDEEKLKGAYVSGRTPDVTNNELTNIRNVVPITDDSGNTKAILFGTINIKAFSDYYKNQLSINDTYLCILDGKSGDFIIDTKDVVSEKNISNLASVKYNKGYNYSEFFDNISNGKQGYVSFIENDSNEFLYVCYDDLGIENWRIMLAHPKSVVFARTRSTTFFLGFASGLICLIILIYVLGVVLFNRKTAKMNYIASEIRRCLLEINHRSESLEDALKILTEYAKSRSAFICDSYGEEFHYIRPDIRGKMDLKELQYFNEKLLYYTATHRKTYGTTIYNSQINADSSFKSEMPEIYDFMVAHNINSITYNVITSNSSNTYVLGVLNPENKETGQLLNKISACFSMAVYNRKHMERTNRMALTDSLTGTKNRMAFKQDKSKNKYKSCDYTCIYVDVNELNYFNNKYGHAAGDQMLKFIGESLMNNFLDSDVYRMGGDEFLILSRITSEEEINRRVEEIIHSVEEMKYHIAVGVRNADSELSIEDAVNEAEKAMYQNKSRYYQDKELAKIKNLTVNDVDVFDTGVAELDACLWVMSMRYFAVFFVSLEKDSFVKILAPSYFKNSNDQSLIFSSSIKRYIHEFVKTDFHRALQNFMEYDALKKQLSEQRIPEIVFERIDGEKVILKVYPVDAHNSTSDSIWVFEKESAR